MNIEEILAERVYRLSGSEEDLRLTIRIGIPRRTSDGQYECAAELQEPDRTTLRHMGGEDAIQAIQLAMVVLGVEMKHINEQIGGGLCWHEAGDDLGLPTYPDFSVFTPTVRAND